MTARLICFPQRRNIGKARHVACLFLKRPAGKERQAYWSAVCNRMVATMTRVGIPQAEIDRQVDAFREAVEWEIGAISSFNDRHHGPGAA